MSARYFSLIMITFMLTGCESKKKPEEILSTDIVEFRKYINLDSFSPISVKWVQGTRGTPSRIALGPEDYYLIAIIKLPKNQFDSLVEQYKGSEDISSGVYWDKKSVRDWYSDGVKRKLVKEGNYFRINGPVYRAITFGSFYSGKYSFFSDDNEVFLHAYTH